MRSATLAHPRSSFAGIGSYCNGSDFGAGQREDDARHGNYRAPAMGAKPPIDGLPNVERGRHTLIWHSWR